MSMQCSNEILVFGPNNEILAHYPIKRLEDAYQYCMELERMGIEIKMHIPSLPEGLAMALGGSSEDCNKIRSEISQEISQHIE